MCACTIVTASCAEIVGLVQENEVARTVARMLDRNFLGRGLMLAHCSGFVSFRLGR